MLTLLRTVHLHVHTYTYVCNLYIHTQYMHRIPPIPRSSHPHSDSSLSRNFPIGLKKIIRAHNSHLHTRNSPLILFFFLELDVHWHYARFDTNIYQFGIFKGPNFSLPLFRVFFCLPSLWPAVTYCRLSISPPDSYVHVHCLGGYVFASY